ncbi:hypothetical protein D1609_05800 [Leptospira borgpetersenii serovar Hardjo-bovis]|nr:hypothetical protein B9T54_05900 [Leptospira borgpetersenii serovar Hardjo-bovis]AYR08090.1 hypothetical protein D1609_05800 [Leptospira borgpetersenii serovar Hardjo-bovis]TQE51999.1 hypothetical protein FFZ95_12210 [Leptospira borgpetersenii]TQE55772.1 hypothetical protein FFZ96_11975 [Leptospira borgpetersenii]
MKRLIFSKGMRNFYGINPTDSEKWEIHVESSIREFAEFRRRFQRWRAFSAVRVRYITIIR